MFPSKQIRVVLCSNNNLFCKKYLHLLPPHYAVDSGYSTFPETLNSEFMLHARMYKTHKHIHTHVCVCVYVCVYTMDAILFFFVFVFI